VFAVTDSSFWWFAFSLAVRPACSASALLGVGQSAACIANGGVETPRTGEVIF